MTDRGLADDGIDAPALRALYESSKDARIILDDFASRKHELREVTVDSLVKRAAVSGLGMHRQQVIPILQRIAKAGCGEFIVGRRGFQSRFVPSVSLAHIGRLAAGGDEHSATPQAISTEQRGQENREVDIVAHVYHLRKGMNISIHLPSDLTAVEAHRLAAFIETLPF